MPKTKTKQTYFRVNFKEHPLDGEKVRLIRIGSLSFTVEVLKDCRPYRQGDRITLMPYELERWEDATGVQAELVVLEVKVLYNASTQEPNPQQRRDFAEKTTRLISNGVRNAIRHANTVTFREMGLDLNVEIKGV